MVLRMLSKKGMPRNANAGGEISMLLGFSSTLLTRRGSQTPVLRTGIACFGAKVDDATSRTQIFITARVSDWRATSDLQRLSVTKVG
jgi:hypothetical protein